MAVVGKEVRCEGKRSELDDLKGVFEKWKKFEIYVLPERRFRFS